MMMQKVVFEFGRRGRKLDFKVMKGEEFRNLSLFFFPLILNSIPKQHGWNERKIWLFFSFQFRALVLPNDEFENVSSNEISNANEKFLILFEGVFGVSNASYNVHMICHLQQIRKRGPLTETSTFPHESYYGEMRNSYVTGTSSTGKQLLTNAYLKRQLPHTTCRKNLRFRAKETSKTCDKYIYTYENGNYKFYVIKEIDEDGNFCCHRIGKRLFKPEETESEPLRWETVGVFKLSAITDQEKKFKKKEIKGKAMIVDDLIMTCPSNVLQE